MLINTTELLLLQQEIIVVYRGIASGNHQIYQPFKMVLFFICKFYCTAINRINTPKIYEQIDGWMDEERKNHTN